MASSSNLELESKELSEFYVPSVMSVVFQRSREKYLVAPLTIRSVQISSVKVSNDYIRFLR